jgi:hypothetical protein
MPRARTFQAANLESPVVYYSAEGGAVTYRLENGRTFRLSRSESLRAGPPRLAHLAECMA